MKPNPRLLPFIPLYGAAVSLRNALYNTGVIPSHKCRVPVISVGNLTAGGTGKTPVVEYLVRLFTARRKKIAVLSRGYGRKTVKPVVLAPAVSREDVSVWELGDELTQLARKFPGVVIAADGDRVRSAVRIEKEFDVDLFLIDDGFQHRSIARDLDIVLIDVTKRVATEPMLPAGYRREPMSSLIRADLLGFTRANFPWTEDARVLARELPGFSVEFVPNSWIDGIFGTHQPLENFSGRDAVAFSGIGNPSAFMGSLNSIGVRPRRESVFDDHHWFTERDIENLMIDTLPGTLFLTTEKDLARMELPVRKMFPEGTLFALEIVAEITQGEDLLLRKIAALGL